MKLEKKLFQILLPDKEEREKIVENNLFIDKCIEKNKQSPKKIIKNSLYKISILHGPKKCNFNCPNYCCTEGISKGDLNKEQIKQVLDQAKKLGTKVTYWPGLGESFLHKDFWEILEYVKSKEMESVVFTNGSVFWNDELALEHLGKTSKELLDKIKKLGTHLYVKYWNSGQEKASQMVGVNEREYPYSKNQIPLVLNVLMKNLPKEKLGVEVMVSKENYKDVVKNILPKINELGIYCYLEPVIFSGKAEGKQKELSLTSKQYNSLKNLFVSGGEYCQKRQSGEMILIGNRMSPGIVIDPRKEDSILNEKGNVKDIFSIYHNNYFRKVRKISNELKGCLCRAVWNGEVKLK